jgi:hypothetical protein
MNECHMNFSFSYKYVSQTCFQRMISMHEMYELWINEFCMIFIIKLWDVEQMTHSQLLEGLKCESK